MKALAIVGTGTQTRENAPWDDPSFDIWVFNEAAGGSAWVKRWDACFQMHPPAIYTAFNRKHAGHWEWLQDKHGKPIYMQAVDPLIPDSVAYPLQCAIDLVGIKYLTSTISYALALAKLQGYERVDIYGVEMSATEYEYQAECYRFWIGYLKGAGIEVNLHSGMPLFETLLYGYEGNLSFDVSHFADRAAQLERDWHLAESNAKAFLVDIKKIIQANKTLQLPDAVRKYHEAIMHSGECAGAMSEAQRYAALGEVVADRGAFELAGATAQKAHAESIIEFWQTLGETRYVGNVWQQTKRDDAGAQLLSWVSRLGTEAYGVGAQMGAYRENIAYIKEYDARALALGITQAPTYTLNEQTEAGLSVR